MIKQALAIIIRFQTFIVLLVLLGVVGYTMHQVSSVVNVAPDPTYIATQTQTINSSTIKFNQTTINAIKELTPVNGTPNPGQVGKSDPFSP